MVLPRLVWLHGIPLCKASTHKEDAAKASGGNIQVVSFEWS